MSPSVSRLLAIVLMASFLRGFQLCSDALSSERPNPTGKTRRSVLTFPPDSVLQINMGITLAGHLEKNSAVIVLAFQQNSPLPREPQPLFPLSVVVEGRRSSIYDHLSHVFAGYGFNGSECLRKMICQMGESPLMGGGLLEDLITFVLSPSKHRSVRSAGAEGEDVKLLLESERLGAGGGNCTSAFPQCDQTPLDKITGFFQG